MAMGGRSKKWDLSNSLWILFSLVPFCYFMSLFYAADRVNTRKYKIWAWIHMAVAVGLVMAVLAGYWEWILGSILHHLMVIIHCLIIRKRFLRDYSRRGAARFETGKDGKWKFVNSLWILLAFLPLVYFVAYFYIGLKVNSRSYKLQGVLHMVLEVAMMTAAIQFGVDICFAFLIWHQLLVICLCLITRKKYLKMLARNEAVRTIRAELASSMAQPETETVRPMDILPEVVTVETEKLNVNRCSEEELCNLPGVGIIEAKKAMEHRVLHGDFRSVEEFIMAAGLKPHMAVRIVDRITAEPTAAFPADRPGRRVLDI